MEKTNECNIINSFKEDNNYQNIKIYLPIKMQKKNRQYLKTVAKL